MTLHFACWDRLTVTVAASRSATTCATRTLKLNQYARCSILSDGETASAHAPTHVPKPGVPGGVFIGLSRRSIRRPQARDCGRAASDGSISGHAWKGAVSVTLGIRQRHVHPAWPSTRSIPMVSTSGKSECAWTVVRATSPAFRANGRQTWHIG